MSMRPIVKDSTNQSVVIRIIDSTTGLPEQAVEHDTGGIAMWYRREGATKQTVATAALAALNTAHTDGGIEHIDDGYYRFDLPDAAVATGVNGVMVGGAVTDMIVMGCYVPLIDVDLYDAVRGGMTALPNAVPGAAGGLLKTDLGRDYDTDLKSAAFAGAGVWVDSAGTASTAWPYGTSPFPTDTIANGKIIADANALKQLRLKGSLTIAAAMEGYSFSGRLHQDATEVVDINGQSVEHSSFENLVITGATGNAALITDQTTYLHCYLYNHTNIHGWVLNGRTEGACSVLDTGYALFHNVVFGSGVACTLTLQAPTICDIENMSGTLTLAGMDGGVCSVSMQRGSILTIDNTCTAGTITITGAGTVADNSGGGCTVTIQVAEADVIQVGSDAQSMTDLKHFADSGYDPATSKVEGVKTVDTTTTNTDMRGTDNAATAAKLLAYIQLLARSDAAIETDNATELTEINADGGSGVGDFSSQTDSGEAIRDVAPHGTAMRGTDNAALASVATEARLAELDAVNLPADIDTLLTRITGLIATKAEMDTAHGLLATEAKQDIIDTVVDSILVDSALMDKWLKNKIAFSGTSMILYDDDNTTPLLTWTLSQGSTTVSGPYNRAKAT